ncbi:MAG: tetratricopeptide repeat protein, partial [Gemmatimonadota bacterium]
MTESLEQEIRTLRSIFWSSRDPEGRAFVPLADAYRRAGEYRQAMELLADGLDRHPDFASAHVVAARLYLETGLVQEAELASRRVRELDGENVMGLRCLASSLRAQGRDDAAAELSAQIRELEGEDGAVASTAPEEAKPVPGEPVVDIADLAPDEAEVGGPAYDVVDVAALAPDEDVVDVAARAPGEDVEDAVAAVVPDEPVVELDALAPTEIDAAEQLERVLPADEEEDENAAPLVTRTLAELYARQGQVARALDVYRQILEAVPGDEDILRRIAELESGIGEAAATDESASEAGESAVDAMAARTPRAGESEAESGEAEEAEEGAGVLEED